MLIGNPFPPPPPPTSDTAVLRIRDVYPRSRIQFSSIPDPNFFHPGSRIRIKEFKYFTQKLFLISKLFIPDPDHDFLPIPDPGVRIRNTGILIFFVQNIAWPTFAQTSEIQIFTEKTT
jgi:hypothetical protein